MSMLEPFQDAHDGTDLPYRMTAEASAQAAASGLSVDEVLAAANDPDRVLKARLDGSRMAHVRGEVSVTVIPAEGTIVSSGRTVVWISDAFGLVA